MSTFRPAAGAHDALLYDSPAHLASVVVPFLTDGLSRGDVIVLATSGVAGHVLLDAVGGDSRVVLLDHSAVYRSRTPTALTSFRQLAERRPSGASAQVRVVGEIDFGPTPRHWPEWQRYEAVLNRYMHEAVWGLCIFDTQRLPELLLDTALRTHPHLATVSGRVANARFTEPGRYLRSLPIPAEPLETTMPSLWITDVRDFAGLRRSVARELAALPDPDLVGDFLLAMDEMTSNAVRHGVGQPPAVDRPGPRRLQHRRRRRRLGRPVRGLRPGARDRSVPRRHGPVAGPAAVRPRRRDLRRARRVGCAHPADHLPVLAVQGDQDTNPSPPARWEQHGQGRRQRP